MSEKKFTDEEIVKALERCIDESMGCVGCPYHGNSCRQMDIDTLDLIHRLQDDYSNLKERYVKVLGLNEKVIAEQKEIIEKQVEIYEKLETSYGELVQKNAKQKAEIERLTEKHERIAWSKQQYLDWVHGFLSTHTDMKDRGEKFEMFDRDWMCGVFWEKIVGSLEYIIELENQRNELQKQVDELKIEMHKIESAENETYMIGFEDGEKQAVKDTAKDIFEAIFFDCWAIKDENGHRVFVEGKIKDLAKKCYGVEVE